MKSDKNHRSKDLGRISYRNHHGIILEDGRAIMDSNTGIVYGSSLNWVKEIDMMEGRKPPSTSTGSFYDCDLSLQNPLKKKVSYDDIVIESNEVNDRQALTKRDDDLIFDIDLDDIDLAHPLEDLIREMDDSVALLEQVTIDEAREVLGRDIETIIDDMVRSKTQTMIDFFQDESKKI